MAWQRYLWSLVTPLTVLVCALFAATSANHWIAGEAFRDPASAAPSQVAPPTAQAPAPSPPSKSGLPLRANNMFCSTCVDRPAEPGPEPGMRTRLPLRLIATNLSTMPAHSFAAVMNTESQRQGAYQIGDHIPDAGQVASIGKDYLEFVRTQDQAIERIDFESGLTRNAQLPIAKTLGTSSSGADLVERYVRIVDETHFEIDRDLVDKVKGNARLAGALARPVSKNGKMTGVRLAGVRSGGLAKAMGLRNGDTLVAANGVKLQSLEAALELMGQLQQKDHWSLDIERGGKALQLQIDLQ